MSHSSSTYNIDPETWALWAKAPKGELPELEAPEITLELPLEPSVEPEASPPPEPKARAEIRHAQCYACEKPVRWNPEYQKVPLCSACR